MPKRKASAAGLRELIEKRYGKEALQLVEEKKNPETEEERFILQLLEVGRTNQLFRVSPCSVTEKDFALRFGLIKQIPGQSPPYDSFKKMTMKRNVIKLVAALHQVEVVNSMRARGDPSNEVKRRGAEDLILCRLRYLTKPGDGDMLVDPVDEDEVDDIADSIFCDKSEGVDHASSSGTGVDPEDELSGRERGDFKVYVFRDGARVLRLVVVSKTLAQPRDILQAAMHAFPEDKHLNKEQMLPVYLMVWERFSWYHGILEIDGYIQVKGGELVEKSLDGFPEFIPYNRLDADFATNFTPSLTKADIRQRFAKWKLDMEHEKLYIPDGRHPVGKLFRTWKMYEFPRFLEDASMSKGKRVFYEGLLKLLVGRDVAAWDEAEVLKRWKKRCLHNDVMKMVDKLGVREQLSKFWADISEDILGVKRAVSDASDSG